ncbi:hypothetical protein AB4Y87_25480 [Paenarthrobacter sp. RAF54_2]|uniref:hypothetical protein n=1 Tax=Paenarthrobacter sp. RAF54_2 TaxID=3233061 RepID=UPI003F993BEA
MDKPPASWLPGLIAGEHRAINGAVCTLDYAEIYPAGVMVHISIRFRGAFDRRRYETERMQVEAAHNNSPLSGPRLVLKQPGAINAYASMISFEDRGGFWTLAYWFIHEPLPEETQLHLSWAETGIDVTFTIMEERITTALSAMEDLTELPWADQETGNGSGP